MTRRSRERCGAGEIRQSLARAADQFEVVRSIAERLHFHLLALDGLYDSNGDHEPFSFECAPQPAVKELQRLVERTAGRWGEQGAAHR